METLVGDFMVKWDDLQQIIDVAPEVVSHNIETVRRLTKEVRIQAKYDRSLELLMRLKKGGMKTKSGIMLGLGETEEEIYETIDDLASVNVDIITMGQYLQPTPKHLEIAHFITPEKFEEYRLYAVGKGFRHVESSPLVRSSYHAEKHIL
jgi:lipoic acid synthetase